MKARVLNHKHGRFANYGGRGITICDRWIGKEGFANFLADLGPKPTPAHSLFRLDNDGPFSPENCTWSEQKFSPAYEEITIAGMTKTRQEWAAAIGVSERTVQRRIQEGWTVEAAITTPPTPRGTGKRKSKQT